VRRQVAARPRGLARRRGGQAAVFQRAVALRRLAPVVVLPPARAPLRLAFAKAPASVSRSHRNRFR